MKTVIYSFSGTGNSLAAAKKIAAALGETELVPIASLEDTAGSVLPAAERIGIVCPVYFSGLPLMVASFAERLEPGSAQYLFAVLTHGGGGESAALRQLDSILRQRKGRGLDAGFGVMMPGNYIMMYESPMGQKQQEILAKADEEIAAIAASVSRMEKVALPSSLINRILYMLIYPWFRSHARTDDKKFSVTDACISCGTCVEVCPAKNIGLVDKKPVWKHRCELCCSCIHTCPVKAIQAGARTEKWGRYRNPDVTVAELKMQKKDTS
ncbi:MULTISPECIES: EFR1 family ferrodoxin [unclassified Methanoregula]|uniref:EFR1 family ferrodoxin n=1 Tax=unclassified Methanoregula TaxID=2649730 RepID=UPI0009CCE8E8|nr:MULTISPECIES: EFR1 family ferrodoxin [unclassified Methanoregula]OPX62849.1 MAG: ferredoxin [Methanoregula sp. PtaB.Bin085]OPY35286.1 MAG: ferredoxin [Methanoregula sp. PtaU1.Bin006]